MQGDAGRCPSGGERGPRWAPACARCNARSAYFTPTALGIFAEGNPCKWAAESRGGGCPYVVHAANYSRGLRLPALSAERDSHVASADARFYGVSLPEFLRTPVRKTAPNASHPQASSHPLSRFHIHSTERHRCGIGFRYQGRSAALRRARRRYRPQLGFYLLLPGGLDGHGEPGVDYSTPWMPT